MHWRDVNLRPNIVVLRQFGGLLAVFGGGLAAWLWFGHNWVEATIGCAVAAVLAVIVALVRPQALRPVFVAFSVLTFPIGWVVSQLMLLTMFYLVITPLAVMFRLLGRDFLDVRTPADSRATFWLPKRTGAHKRSYFRQF